MAKHNFNSIKFGLIRLQELLNKCDNEPSLEKNINMDIGYSLILLIGITKNNYLNQAIIG